MRYGALEFARDVAENFTLSDPLVEVGARAADGQEDFADLRGLFHSQTHIGCDLQAGPGVDRVDDIHRLAMPDNSVGTMLCLETLEHVADPLRAVAEMCRVLRPGGLLAISSLMFFPIHAHPWDYWRFTPEGFDLLLRPFQSRLVTAHGWEHMPEGVYGIGIKGPAPDLGVDRLPRLQALAGAFGRDERVDFGPIRMTTRQLWGFAVRYTGEALRERAHDVVARARRL